MENSKMTLVVPLLLITIGVGWLLMVLGVAPEIDWIWTLGLALAGLLALLMDGWNKFTAVVGPFFLFASCLSVARQTGRIDLNVEMPILVIVVGGLILLARSSAIPMPKWVLESKGETRGDIGR